MRETTRTQESKKQRSNENNPRLLAFHCHRFVSNEQYEKSTNRQQKTKHKQETRMSGRGREKVAVTRKVAVQGGKKSRSVTPVPVPAPAAPAPAPLAKPKPTAKIAKTTKANPRQKAKETSSEQVLLDEFDVVVPPALLDALAGKHVAQSAPPSRSHALDEQLATDVTEVEEHAVKVIEMTGFEGEAALDGLSAAQMDGRASLPDDDEDADDDGSSKSDSDSEADAEDDGSSTSGSEESDESKSDDDNVPHFAPSAEVRARVGNAVPIVAKMTSRSEPQPFGSKSSDALAGGNAKGDYEDTDEEDDDNDDDDEDKHATNSSVRLNTREIAAAVKDLKPHPKFSQHAMAQHSVATQRVLDKMLAEKRSAAAPHASASASAPAPASAPKNTIKSKSSSTVTFARARVPSEASESNEESEDDSDEEAPAAPIKLTFASAKAKASTSTKAALTPSKSKKTQPHQTHDDTGDLGEEDDVTALRALLEAKRKDAATASKRRDEASARAAAEATTTAAAERKKNKDIAARAAIRRELEELAAKEAADIEEANAIDFARLKRKAQAERERAEEADLDAMTPLERKKKAKDDARIKTLAAAAVAERASRRAATQHERAEIEAEVLHNEREREGAIERAVRLAVEVEERKAAEARAAKSAKATSRAQHNDVVTAGGAAPYALVDEDDEDEDAKEAFLSKWLAEHNDNLELQEHASAVDWMNPSKLKLKEDKTETYGFEKLEAARPELMAMARERYRREFEAEEIARMSLKASASVRVTPKKLKELDDAKDMARKIAAEAFEAQQRESAAKSKAERATKAKTRVQDAFKRWHARDVLVRLWCDTTGGEPAEMTAKFMRKQSAIAAAQVKLEEANKTALRELLPRFATWHAAEIRREADEAAEEARRAALLDKTRGNGGVNTLKLVHDALHARPEGPPRNFSGAPAGAHLAALSHRLQRHEGPPRNARDE